MSLAHVVGVIRKPGAPGFSGVTTLSTLDRAAVITPSNSNRTATRGGGSTDVGIRSTNSHSDGKFYFEYVVNSTVGIYEFVGIVNEDWNILNAYWTTSYASNYGLNRSAVVIPGSSSGVTAFSSALANGDRIGFAVDLTNKKIWVRKNNGAWNPSVAGTQDPATNAGGISCSSAKKSSHYVGCYLYTGTPQYTFAFLASDMVDAIPSGFSAWATQPAAPGAHRYWRVFGRSNQSGWGGATSALSADEIEFRETTGGADATGSGTAAADSSFSGTYLPANAFANNAGTTFWVSVNSNAGTHWISYDFGSGVTKQITEVAWSKRSDAFGDSESLITATVQWSDNNTNWNTAWDVNLVTPWSSGAQTRIFTGPS